jgi:hypothetical protein
MGGMGGGGMFSIPSEKVAQVPFTTVCLNHGKPDPKPKMTYKLVPIETFTSDTVLRELVSMVGTGKLESSAAQAAVWHLSDHMSWEQLAAKKIEHVGGVPPEPYFTSSQMSSAQGLVAQAQGRVREREREGNEPASPAKSGNRRLETKS